LWNIDNSLSLHKIQNAVNINKEIQQKIINQLRQYNPLYIGLFGSYARGDNDEHSDLDILVSFSSRLTLIDLVRIKNQLSENLNITIDLITEQSLHPKIKSYIKKDLQMIYYAEK